VCFSTYFVLQPLIYQWRHRLVLRLYRWCCLPHQIWVPPPSVAMTSSIDPASWTDAGAIILSNPPGYSLVSLFYCLLCEDRPNARDARDGNIISTDGILRSKMINVKIQQTIMEHSGWDYFRFFSESQT